MYRFSIIHTQIVGFLLVLLASVLTVSSFGAPVTSLTTHWESVTDTGDNYSISGAGTTGYPSDSTYDIGFGANSGGQDNRVIDGFATAGGNYVFAELADWINIKRVDNAVVSGTRNLLFYEQNIAPSGSIVPLRPERAQTMESALESRIVNRGSDNLFGNQGDSSNNNNNNNVERVDFVFAPGWIVSDPAALNEVGFIVLERGGNDTFKIASITGVSNGSEPTNFSTLVTGGSAAAPAFQWGNTGLSITTTVFRRDAGNLDLNPSTNVSSQNINGVYFSLADLGIGVNQRFYGYSLFGGDVTSSMDLVTLAGFPTNTASDSGEQGGLDLIAGGTVLYNTDLGFFPLIAIPEPATGILLLLFAAASTLCRRPITRR